MKITDNESLEREIIKNYSYKNYEKILNALKKIERLTYRDSESRSENLLELLEYLTVMLNGDEIRQITSYNRLNSTARKALGELSDSINKERLESVNSEVENLKSVVERLKSEIEGYTNHINALSNKRSQLSLQVDALIKNVNDSIRRIEYLREDATKEVEREKEQKLIELESELQQKRSETLRKIDDEANESRSKVKDEISSYEEALKELIDDKARLESIVKSLKEEYQRNLDTLTGLGLRKEELVVWESISSNDPILSVTPKTIKRYLEELKQTYMFKTSVSKEETEREFNANCPGFVMLEEVMRSYDDSYSDYPLRRLAYTHWNGQNMSARASALENLIKQLKVPKYKEKTSVVASVLDLKEFKMEEIPSNMNGLLREMKLERIAMDAICKQRIAEAQLQVALDIIKKMSVENNDLNYLFDGLNTQNPLISGLISEVSDTQETKLS